MNEHTDLVMRNQIASIGMSDGQRLALLTSKETVVPGRQIGFTQEEDPFDLLTHEDTYSALAGTIFTECEGIYYQLARHNSDVQKQYAKASKQKVSSVTLPTVSLGNLYKFNLVRSSSGQVEQYIFSRQDERDVNRGFVVLRSPSGDCVLKKIDYTGDKLPDEQYFGLLKSAQRWVEDYAAQLHISPKGLLDLAENAP